MFLGKSPWGAPRKNPQDAPAVSVGFGLDEALLGCDARVHVQQGWNLLLDRQRGTPRGGKHKGGKNRLFQQICKHIVLLFQHMVFGNQYCFIGKLIGKNLGTGQQIDVI